MEHLAHWDFTEEFSGYDAAALILGLEPKQSTNDSHRVWVVRDRMERDYNQAIQRAQLEDGFFVDEEDLLESLGKRPTGMLKSVKLEMLWSDLSEGLEKPFREWLSAPWEPWQFHTQFFNRAAIAEWLKEIGMPSVYRFDLSLAGAPEVRQVDVIDPGELPDELQAANIAFRAVTNGFGDKSATFRNRLMAYLKTHFTDLGDEAVNRIATVANPDKERGRKKISH